MVVETLILSGSLALLSGGGAFAVTRSHYQRRLRELEARLREALETLRVREAELEAARAVIAQLRERLTERERRLADLTESIAALRELTQDLDRRLEAHSAFMRRALAALTLRMARHRREGEALVERIAHAEDTIDTFGRERMELTSEVVRLRQSLRESEGALAAAQSAFGEAQAEAQRRAAELEAATR